MANSKQILNKIARDAQMLGLTVQSNTGTSVIIDDGANDILIEYVDAIIQDPMGGVSPATAPFLGAGHNAPGKIAFSCNAAGNKTIAQIFVNEQNVKAFALCCGFANNVIVLDGNEGYGTAAVLLEVDGSPDMKGLGQ